MRFETDHIGSTGGNQVSPHNIEVGVGKKICNTPTYREQLL